MFAQAAPPFCRTYVKNDSEAFDGVKSNKIKVKKIAGCSAQLFGRVARRCYLEKQQATQICDD
jgi:hypothetical protein